MNVKDRRGALLDEWRRIEATLPKRGSLDYQLAWGAAREKFYKQVGYIPCPDADAERLKALRDKFTGERIFVIGNGPSLNKTPLHLLKNEFTFVTNRAYLLFDRLCWRPTFYTALDWRVVPDTAHEMNLLNGMICFFEERFRGLLREGDDVFWYTHTPAPSRAEATFAYDLTLGVRGAGSVIGTAIQIAFYLGFREIYLIGCDLGYRVNTTVQQEGDDVFGTGTKLLLTSTQDDDPNHFDKRYFGKNRRWHDPNVKRMIAGHEQCKSGVQAGGGKILNATVGGELEVYPRVDFTSLLASTQTSSPRKKINSLLPPLTAVPPIPSSKGMLLGPMLRCEKVSLDETSVVHELMGEMRIPRIMLDVGAHRGTSCIKFLDAGWKIIAFEPDPANRAGLIKRVKSSKYHNNIVIDDRAVSNRSRNGVPLFTSKESSGISALNAFHSSHRESSTTDVTTLTDYFRDQPSLEIDFLKSDTEGHDLFVLQGFPWERCNPSVIECEFEDSKTVPLGYTFHDLAKFLVEKQYTVYVSEWHPVIRYGIPHDWASLTRYPCELSDSKAWGNLLAFREPVDEAALVSAVRRVMKTGTRQAAAAAAAPMSVVPTIPAKQDLKPPSRPGAAVVPMSVVPTLPAKQDIKVPSVRRHSSTLVILGNGPSIKGFDFARLRQFDAIGMNAAYRYWDKIGWYPRYYICLDKVVGLSHSGEIARLIRNRVSNGIEKFLLRRNLIDELPQDLASLECVVNYDALLVTSDLFPHMPATTGSQAALFGVLLGYERMILMGVDCNYVERVRGVKEIEGSVLELTEALADNPNYFFGGYQVAGDRFNIPNPVPDLHLNSWRAAAPVLAARGVKVWNGSFISRVDVFPKRDFAEIEQEEAAFRNNGRRDTPMELPAMADAGRTAAKLQPTWASTGLEAKATLSVSMKRSQEMLVILGDIARLSKDELSCLHVEADGVQVPSKVYVDINPACIVARVPARRAVQQGATMVSLVMRRAGLITGESNDALSGLTTPSLMAVVPMKPSLPDRFEGSLLDTIRRYVSLSHQLKDMEEFPLSHFDGVSYLKRYTDVAKAVLSGSMPSALEHYRAYGRKEGRRFFVASARGPNEGRITDCFDGVAYLRAHHDVADAIRSGTLSSALEHYIKHGRNEARQVFTRFDGVVCRGTALDVARLDAVRETRAGMVAFKAHTDAEIGKLADSLSDLQAKLTAEKAELAKLRSDLQAELGAAKTALAKVRTDLQARSAGLGTEMANLQRDVQHRLSDGKADIAAIRSELQGGMKAGKAEIGELRTKLQSGLSAGRADIAAVRSELQGEMEAGKTEIGELRTKLQAGLSAGRADIAAVRSELQDGMEAGKAEIGELRAKLQAGKADLVRLRSDIKSELAAENAELAQVRSALQAGLVAEQAEVAHLQSELKAVKSQAAMAIEKTNATSARISHASLDTFNVLGYQAHPRALTKASAERLSGHWAPLLGVNVQIKELYYLAHRVCCLENMCLGRLATPINDILLRILVARSIKHKDLEIAEIGTLFGLGVGALHEALSLLFERVHFTVIDPLDGYYGKGNFDVMTRVPVKRAAFDENLRRMGIDRDKVTLIQRLSTEPETVKRAAKTSYDMLVIDGDHSYAGVKHDTESYLDMVKADGYVLFDDYNNKAWPDVKQYVDAEVMPRENLKFVGADWHTAIFRVTSLRRSQASR